MSPAPPAALEFAARLEPWIETGVGATLSSPFARPRPLPGELIVLLDNNQDGLVSDQEVHQAAAVFQRLANSRDRSRSGQAILESLDLNRDGVLDQPEALQGAGYARLSVEGLGKAFSLLLGVLDANADGLVTVSELTRLVDRLGRMRQAVEPRLPQLFASLDANGDGMISVVESQMGADAFVRQSGIEIQLLGVPGQQQLTPAVMPTVRAKIQRLDRNRDGRLSRREAKPDDLLRQAFGDVDRDGDNTLAPGEIYDYLKTRLPPQPQWRGIRLRVNVPRAVPMRNR